MADQKSIRVFIVDDHPIVREGLAQLVEREADMSVCGEADDAPGALEAMEETKPDIVLVDISLKGMNGLQLIKDISIRLPKVAALVLSMHEERVYAERALHAGARGYVMKQEATKKVVSAIRHVLGGQVYLSDDSVSRLMHKCAGCREAPNEYSVESLTDRELEVFQLVGQGFKPSEIGRKLNLSVKTIETYIEHIKNKLNIGGSAELTRHAIEWVHGEKD